MFDKNLSSPFLCVAMDMLCTRWVLSLCWDPCFKKSKKRCALSFWFTGRFEWRAVMMTELSSTLRSVSAFSQSANALRAFVSGAFCLPCSLERDALHRQLRRVTQLTMTQNVKITFFLFIPSAMLSLYYYNIFLSQRPIYNKSVLPPSSDLSLFRVSCCCRSLSLLPFYRATRNMRTHRLIFFFGFLRHTSNLCIESCNAGQSTTVGPFSYCTIPNCPAVTFLPPPPPPAVDVNPNRG